MPGSSVKLQASLQGLGPVFRVRVTVKNSGVCSCSLQQCLGARACDARASGAAVAHAVVAVSCDAGTHSVSDPVFKVGPVCAHAALPSRVMSPQLGTLAPACAYSKHVYISCNEPVTAWFSRVLRHAHFMRCCRKRICQVLRRSWCRPPLLNKLSVSPLAPFVSARIPQVSTATSSAPLGCIIVSIPAPAADF